MLLMEQRGCNSLEAKAFLPRMDLKHSAGKKTLVGLKVVSVNKIISQSYQAYLTSHACINAKTSPARVSRC